MDIRDAATPGPVVDVKLPSLDRFAEKTLVMPPTHGQPASTLLTLFQSSEVVHEIDKAFHLLDSNDEARTATRGATDFT